MPAIRQAWHEGRIGALSSTKVYARDRWRCTVPGRRSRRHPHAHHVRRRSQGGSDSLPNLTTVCAMHHLQGLHKDRLRVSGQAPDALTWELGIAPDGRPALVIGPGEVIRPRR